MKVLGASEIKLGTKCVVLPSELTTLTPLNQSPGNNFQRIRLIFYRQSLIYIAIVSREFYGNPTKPSVAARDVISRLYAIIGNKCKSSDREKRHALLDVQTISTKFFTVTHKGSTQQVRNFEQNPTTL